MVSLLLLLLMIAALCGMVFCNRRQRKDAKFQIIALVLLVVVIASGGMFMCRLDTLSLLGFSDNGSQSAALENKLNESQGYMVANFIKNSYPGKRKVLLIAPAGLEVFGRALLTQLHESKVGTLWQEQLTSSGGNADTLITPVADYSAEARQIDAAIDRHPDAQVVIIAGIAPSGDSLQRLKVYRKSYESRPRIIILGLTNLNDWAYRQMQDGKIDALIVTDLTKALPDAKEPVPENLLEVFNSRYVLISKDNLRRNRRFFH